MNAYDTTTALQALALSVPLGVSFALYVFPEQVSAVFAAFARRPYSEVDPDQWKRPQREEMTKEEYRAWVRHEFDTTARMDGIRSAMSFLESIPDMDDWPPQSEIDAALEAEGIEKEVERRKDNAPPVRSRWKSKYRREGDDTGDLVDSSRYTRQR